MLSVVLPIGLGETKRKRWHRVIEVLVFIYEGSFCTFVVLNWSIKKLDHNYYSKIGVSIVDNCLCISLFIPCSFWSFSTWLLFLFQFVDMFVDVIRERWSVLIVFLIPLYPVCRQIFKCKCMRWVYSACQKTDKIKLFMVWRLRQKSKEVFEPTIPPHERAGSVFLRHLTCWRSPYFVKSIFCSVEQLFLFHQLSIKTVVEKMIYPMANSVQWGVVILNYRDPYSL